MSLQQNRDDVKTPRSEAQRLGVKTMAMEREGKITSYRGWMLRERIIAAEHPFLRDDPEGKSAFADLTKIEKVLDCPTCCGEGVVPVTTIKLEDTRFVASVTIKKLCPVCGG